MRPEQPPEEGLEAQAPPDKTPGWSPCNGKRAEALELYRHRRGDENIL
jgi:hypothetical protein